MRPGEVQRWRLVGAQYQDNMLLELDRHRLNVVAYDGIPLGAMEEMKQLLMAPGQRADVLVQAGSPGTYIVLRRGGSEDQRAPAGDFAVADRPSSMPCRSIRATRRPPDRWRVWWSPASRCRCGSQPRCPSRRLLPRATGRNSLSRWTAGPSIPHPSTSGCGSAPWRNGRSATPTSTTTTCSTSNTNPFQVVAIGGQPQADRPWRDTAVVPRPARGGSIVIRSRFLD
jgi:hypothetical protein